MTESWQIARGREVSLRPWALMGIVNVTPDSFSDGGLYSRHDAAVKRALSMIEEGATIIDIGGESTRPGASRVEASEQIARILKVVSRLRMVSDVPISIDTTLVTVARLCVDAGADIVNDVSAGSDDPTMLEFVRDSGAGFALMHRVAPPDRDRFSTEYTVPRMTGDVVASVRDWLRERTEAAVGTGIERQRIAIDPGLGFGKSVAQNFELIARVGELAELGYPILVGASRKSFIGEASGVGRPASRLAGSIVAACSAWRAGARIIRTHDVAATREALAVAQAIVDAGAPAMRSACRSDSR